MSRSCVWKDPWVMWLLFISTNCLKIGYPEFQWISWLNISFLLFFPFKIWPFDDIPMRFLLQHLGSRSFAHETCLPCWRQCLRCHHLMTWITSRYPVSVTGYPLVKKSCVNLINPLAMFFFFTTSESCVVQKFKTQLSLSLQIYTYNHIYICICVYIYTYS